MITVQEVTKWNGNTPNHKYILSNERTKAYGYIKCGDRLPTLFSTPYKFDVRNRKFTILLKTGD